MAVTRLSYLEALAEIERLRDACNRLLQIADLAAYYAPGELGESYGKMIADIDFARGVLGELPEARADEHGYWTRRISGGLHYHAYDPATEDDDGPPPWGE